MTQDDRALLYHWTTLTKALTALRIDCLQARRWVHYLEAEDRMFRGTSWSLDPHRWSADNPVCLVMRGSMLPNAIHAINGNRVFLQTKGMTHPLYDPRAYLLESTEPDEEFVEGPVRKLSEVLLEVRVRCLSVNEVGLIRSCAGMTNVDLQSIDDVAEPLFPHR